MTSTPPANCSLKAFSSASLFSLRRVVSSAPRAFIDWRVAACRPVAMTLFAPRYFAACTARRPDVPVAPFTSTVSPTVKLARSFKATHDDMPGMAIAAAVYIVQAVRHDCALRRRHHDLFCHAAIRGSRQEKMYAA